MHTFLRNVHGLVALLLSAFIAMYALTGFVIFHPGVVSDHQLVEERLVPFESMRNRIADSSLVSIAQLRSQAETIRRAAGISARFESVQAEHDGMYIFVYQKPGVEVRVSISPSEDGLRITTVRHGAAEMLKRLHRMDGFSGGGPYFLWGVLVDLVAISLIVLAVSGVGLWYSIKVTRRWLGTVLIVGSLSFTIGSIVVLLG